MRVQLLILCSGVWNALHGRFLGLSVARMAYAAADRFAVARRVHCRALSVAVPRHWAVSEVSQRGMIQIAPAELTPLVMIVIDVSGADVDAQSPNQIQRFAEMFVPRVLNGRIVANNIGLIAGRPCSDFLYETRTEFGRKLTLVVHGTEYGIRIRAAGRTVYEQILPLLKTLLATVEIEVPRHTMRASLGGRASIGLPADWVAVSEREDAAEYRSQSGDTTLRVHFVSDGYGVTFDERVFASYGSRRGNTSASRLIMADLGISCLACGEPPKGSAGRRWTAVAAQLPSGLALLLELECPSETLVIGPFGSFSLLLEIVATVTDPRGTTRLPSLV